jgi:Mrp family chromosome partitioning ATPase
MKTLLEVATARPSEAAGEVSNDADAELWKLWHEADEEVNGHAEDRAPRIQKLVAPPVIRIGDRGRVTVIDVGPAASTSMHRRTKGEFDLVVADGPPMLDGDHINEIVRSAGAVVIVVRHRGKAEDARQLIGRLDLLGVRPLGYVYNRGGSSRKRWIRRLSVRHGGDVPDQAEQQRRVYTSVEDDLVERR